MRKPRHIIAMLGVVLLTSLVLAGCGPLNAQAAPEPVYGAATPEEAAQQDLPRFLAMARTDFAAHGFRSQQEMDQVTLGEPYQVYNLAGEAVLEYRPGQSLAKVLVKVPALDFPMFVNGEPRGFLGVAQQDDGRWEAHSIGGISVSQQLAQWRQQPGNANLPRNIVVFPELGAQLALVDTPGKERLVPLHPIRGLAQSPEQTVLRSFTGDEIIPALAQTLARVVENAKPLEQRSQP